MPTGSPFYETPEELQKAIDDYFEKPDRFRSYTVGTGDNAQTINVPIFTITGMALRLGFCDRHSMYDYEKREGFSHTIKKARSFIERIYEELIQQGNCTGAIFALKNFGWKDKQELAVEGDITTNVNFALIAQRAKEID